ncbi:MAG: deoxynucleoside kinase [Clostridiales bacterium]|nr:deoxynucleoside kinase [Clostridiales bacterium]
MSGKLIVIEGLDGSGKSTQIELLMRRLESNGIKIRQIKLPDYDSPSSSLVKMYLAGSFGDKPGDVNAYAASSFYAVDRYANFKNKWAEDYYDGKCILSDRYATSNAYHQSIKLPEEKWVEYLNWLEDFEYNKIGIPRPDIVFYLDMPIEISQRLLSRRTRELKVDKDIHEADTDYLKKCRKAALFSCEHYGWKLIPCSNNGEPLSVREINDSLFSMVIKEIK